MKTATVLTRPEAIEVAEAILAWSISAARSMSTPLPSSANSYQVDQRRVVPPRARHGNVEFLDSAGLGVLVYGLKRVRAHDGSMRLVCTQEQILKKFRVAGLTKTFPTYTSVADAVSALP